MFKHKNLQDNQKKLLNLKLGYLDALKIVYSKIIMMLFLIIGVNYLLILFFNTKDYIVTIIIVVLSFIIFFSLYILIEYLKEKRTLINKK